eukprot:1159625-Pelagomonas_calceolata.AAC.11
MCLKKSFLASNTAGSGALGTAKEGRYLGTEGEKVAWKGASAVLDAAYQGVVMPPELLAHSFAV